MGATDLKVAIAVSGKGSESLSGTAKFKALPTNNLSFGGGSQAQTTFFTVKDPAGQLSVNVSTATRQDSRTVVVGGANC